MSELEAIAAAAERPPEPDWSAITAEELVAYRLRMLRLMKGCLTEGW